MSFFKRVLCIIPLLFAGIGINACDCILRINYFKAADVVFQGYVVDVKDLHDSVGCCFRFGFRVVKWLKGGNGQNYFHIYQTDIVAPACGSPFYINDTLEVYVRCGGGSDTACLYFTDVCSGTFRLGQHWWSPSDTVGSND